MKEESPPTTRAKHQVAPSRRIHVAHVMTSLEPGGLENGVVNLSNRLDPDRFRTSIICLERVGEFRERLRPEVHVECLEKGPGFRWGAARQIGRRVAEWEIDVLHTHNLGPLTYGSLGRYLSRCRCGLVQGEHAELRPDEKSLKKRGMRGLGYLACRSVHTVSSALRDELIAFGLPGRKIRVILNGVDCDHFSPATSDEKARLKSELGLGASERIIGIVGRFGEFKGHLRLMDAFERLAVEAPDLTLLIVGDHGPRKEAVLDRLRRSEIRDRMRWVGFQEDPAPYYRMMDLLAIPSENEGLSNAMLEAMACGVPCLANQACGAAEIIADRPCGFLGALDRVELLTDALRDIFLAPGRDLAEFGKQARRRVREDFSMEAMVSAYAAMYEEAATFRG